MNQLSRARPLRHSRFLPNFIEMSDVGIRRITHDLHKKEQPIRNQRQAPKRTADLKKVEKIELETLAENVFIQIYFSLWNQNLMFLIIRQGKPIRKKLAKLSLNCRNNLLKCNFPNLVNQFLVKFIKKIQRSLLKM